MTLTICNTEIGGDVLENDYVVKEDGYGCGRIRQALGLGASSHWEWHINPPVPVSGQRVGRADSFERAKDDFKAAWTSIRPTLTDKQIAHWHELADSVRERFGT